MFESIQEQKKRLKLITSLADTTQGQVHIVGPTLCADHRRYKIQLHARESWLFCSVCGCFQFPMSLVQSPMCWPREQLSANVRQQQRCFWPGNREGIFEIP